MRPHSNAGYLSVKPCGRSDVVDTWPVKDTSGRQWWFLGPDGGAVQPDINGKPVNIKVRMPSVRSSAVFLLAERC